MLTNKLTGAGAADKTYVEDVFSTYLYTGNGASQTINNGIQLGDGFNITAGTPLGGGYFAGFINQGGGTYAVIVSPKASGENSSKTWKGTTDAGPAATQTLNNGPAASSAMNSATYPAAQFCEGLTIGGYSDWYLPSRDELELCYRAFKPTTAANDTSSRSTSAYTYSEGNDVTGDTIGVNRNSNPTGSAYTSGSPAQTSIAAFRSGGSEAFATVDYWSSSEYSSTHAWAQSFGSGLQSEGNKSFTRYVRAVRRIAVSDSALDPYRVTGKGGMVWCKARSAAYDNYITDTARDIGYALSSNNTLAQAGDWSIAAAASGFNINASGSNSINNSGTTYASWTFRKAPKFFDVQTKSHTNGSASTVDLSTLGAVGMVMVKRTDSTGNWYVWHRSLTSGYNAYLNTTAAQFNTNAYLSVSGTTLTIASGMPTGTYVVYGYAHDTTADGLIQCGSFTTDANGNATVDLGWEPQYLIIKRSVGGVSSWIISDSMRGMPVSSSGTFVDQKNLYANLADAEAGGINTQIKATGFDVHWVASSTIIYLAIRRGPMRTPTDGAKVFAPVSQAALGTVVTSFPVDMFISTRRSGVDPKALFTRSLGDKGRLDTNLTDAENVAGTSWTKFDSNTSVSDLTWGSNTIIYLNFKRAPGFFDVVCYTGTGVARTVNHNLGVAPELMIVKPRSIIGNWLVYNNSIGNTSFLVFNQNYEVQNTLDLWRSQNPTATTFPLGTYDVNDSGATFVAYLFASCPGVSKVGSYTGNGSSQTINCGFAAGARFVLIKRTDSTGDWYVWDTARGIVSANDPHLSLNSTAAEVTTDDSIDPDNSGFIVNQVAATNINVSNATYVYLSVA